MSNQASKDQQAAAPDQPRVKSRIYTRHTFTPQKAAFAGLTRWGKDVRAPVSLAKLNWGRDREP